MCGSYAVRCCALDGGWCYLGIVGGSGILGLDWGRGMSASFVSFWDWGEWSGGVDGFLRLVLLLLLLLFLLLDGV